MRLYVVEHEWVRVLTEIDVYELVHLVSQLHLQQCDPVRVPMHEAAPLASMQ